MLRYVLLLALGMYPFSAISQDGVANSPPPSPYFSSGDPDPAYGSWSIYTSHRSVLQVASLEGDQGSDAIVSTTGGFYILNPQGQLTAYTRADGKYDLNATAMAVDKTRGIVWFSYADGTLSSFDLRTYRFRHFNDISRNDRFTSNRINHLYLEGERLYIATDFGLVVFNTEGFFVVDSYTRFGRLSSNTPVRYVGLNDDKIYLGTDFGIAAGHRDNDLKVAEQWEVFDGQNGFQSRQVSLVEASGNRIVAVADGVNYYFDGTGWGVLTEFPAEIRSINKRGNSDWDVVSGNAMYRFDPLNRTLDNLLIASGANRLTSSARVQGYLLAGTHDQGLAIRAFNAPATTVNYLVPEGPAHNLFERLSFSSRGELLVGASTTPGQFDIGIYDTGFSILNREGGWRNINRTTSPLLQERGLTSFFSTASQGGQYFFGSWGGGIVRMDAQSGELVHYNNQNFALEGINGAPQFYVATGLSADRQNEHYVWAVSWSNTSRPLARYDIRTNEWVTYPQLSMAGVGSIYREVFVDTHGQKWITLMTGTMSGRGLLVVRNPEGGSGEAIRLSTNPDFGGLSNDKVNAIVQDRRGEVWIGTDRGIGRFLFPDRVITGSVMERRAQPLINEDTTAFDRVLLRDVRVTAMAVDAANQKWVGSQGDGVYLIEESGRRVVHHFTRENSPLPTNNIKSITIDHTTGDVYMSTENALVRYRAIEREGESRMSTLRVFPNPYSYSRNDGQRIVIEDLSDDATVHVMTVDGRLVRRFQTRGGRVDWDGLDQSGQKVATGVYFIVATGNNSDQVARGRVVIVR